MDYSSITDHKVVKKLRNFVKQQRMNYRLRQENKKSPLTDDRYNALVAAKFYFKAGKKSAKANSQDDALP